MADPLYGTYDYEEEERKRRQAAALGGAATGAATGAQIGATVGSVVPGVGNVVGAGVGLGVGALAGGLAGLKMAGKSSTAARAAALEGQLASGQGGLSDRERLAQFNQLQMAGGKASQEALNEAARRSMTGATAGDIALANQYAADASRRDAAAASRDVLSADVQREREQREELAALQAAHQQEVKSSQEEMKARAAEAYKESMRSVLATQTIEGIAPGSAEVKKVADQMGISEKQAYDLILLYSENQEELDKLLQEGGLGRGTPVGAKSGPVKTTGAQPIGNYFFGGQRYATDPYGSY